MAHGTGHDMSRNGRFLHPFLGFQFAPCVTNGCVARNRRQAIEAGLGHSRSFLVVHSLNSRHFWKLCNARATWRLMPPPSAPHKGMFVRIPIGCSIFHRLLDFLPGFKAPSFERQ